MRYDREIANAKKQIEKDGEVVTYRQIFTEDDITKPWQEKEMTRLDHSVSICFLPVNRQTLESLNLKNEDVPAGSVIGLMAGGINFEPNLKDIVIRNGAELRIFYIDVLKPNHQNVLFTFLLKL